MPLLRLVRLGVGWLLVIVGVLLVPVCWVAAGIHHAMTCPGFFLCHESLLDFLAHVLLVTLSPQVAVALVVSGNELRERR